MDRKIIRNKLRNAFGNKGLRWAWNEYRLSGDKFLKKYGIK